ncbi:MAG: hypothetical protein GAK32_01812 [Pseudomonas fluorescens]|nr:MAG: hypothetical protein GAK32_01812 [Pseudomonas fluorescens]
MSDSLPMREAARLVRVSPIAMRPDAGASSRASGVRSPMAMASPVYTSKLVAVTATSATGTCHGPTIWSRATRPVMVRSPMVIRKLLLATAGWCSTRSMLSDTLRVLGSKSSPCSASRTTERCMRGGLPSSTSSGMSTGLLPKWLSVTVSCGSAVASPTTANGQRSRSQMAWKRAKSSGPTAST